MATVVCAAAGGLAAPAQAATQTFSYVAPAPAGLPVTGQPALVPDGMHGALVELYGAKGGGSGAHVVAGIAVTPGETLQVFVGGMPPGPGGFFGGGNGGGSGGSTTDTTSAGGGATDVRQAGMALGNRVLVAGGGGGAGGVNALLPAVPTSGGQGGASDTAGGAGSGEALGGGGGAPGSANGTGGTAGTSTAIGALPGAPGTAGSLGTGGAAFPPFGGGGGGGGLFGGGAGGGGATVAGVTPAAGGNGGGGGGSSLTGADGYVDQGVNADNGRATITYSATVPVVTRPTTGSPVTPSGLQTRDTVRPLLGSLSFSTTTFKAAKSGASTSKKKKVPTGTKVSFNLSEFSAVKFTVERKTKGRKVGKKCKAQTKSNKKKKACTRWVKVKGSFTVAAKAGKTRFTFRGRVGGKSLKPGSYRLTGTATDPSRNVSLPKRKAFKIVK
jgi:hypothetical protein